MAGKKWLNISAFLLFLFSPPLINAIGLKIIKQFPEGILTESMQWQIETFDDWIFIATDDGLIQLNGDFPEIFPLNNNRPNRSVTFDKEANKIFVGGISEFGYFKPSATNSLEYICLSDSVGDDKYIGNIWGIYHKDGVVYAQGDKAVLKYDTNVGKHTIINSDYKLDTSHWINDILWLGTDDGLKVLLGPNIVDAPGTEKLKNKRIREILPFNQGYLIVTSDGIWLYEGRTLKSFTVTTEALHELGEIFSADLNGNILALGSVANGIGIINLETGDTKIYDEARGLPNNTVISLKFNEDGNLWAGLQYSLAKVMLNQPIERIDNSLLPIGSGYVMAELDNNLFLGTNRGVYSIPFKDYKKSLDAKFKYYDGLQGQVWGLSNIDGDLICSHDRGLFILKDDAQVERIGDISGVWDIQKMISNPNKAYVGTYSGLYLIEKINGKWNIKSKINGFDESMFNFAQESPDVIWLDNAENGMVRLSVDTINYKIKEIKKFNKANDGFPLISNVYISRIDNNILFSTSNGIYIYDNKTGEIRRERDISKLLNNPPVVRRLKKTNGSIFALTDKELLEADPAGILDMTHLPLEPSLTRPIHEKDVFFPIGNDYIGYPTRNGYLIFDYSDRSDSFWGKNPARARINLVTVTNDKDSIIFRGNFADLKEEPILSHKENSLRFTFGNPGEVMNGVRYSTHLNREPWSSPSAVISKEYNNLKGGRYQFEVKAVSPDGSESVDTFTFRVKPPWWRSNWMLCLYALILISLVFLLIRFEQIRVVKKQQKILSEKNREIEQQKLRHLRETEDKNRHIEALEREHIENDLRHKAQEMANMMISLSHKNDALQYVKNELQNVIRLIPKSNSDARSAVKDLQDKIVVDIKSDEVLKRVEEEFDFVHNNFMKKLREFYPSLTNNEILLCAYLKINLSSKEIAPLLNISQRGVETMRYRLRKKLNLDREASLSNFIANFN